MNTNNLTIPLDIRLDGKKNVYYLGRVKFPGTISLADGITFLIFLSDSGEEELQIACNDKDNTSFSKFNKKSDKMKISIESRIDKHKSMFYIAKLNYNGYIDCSREVSFMVFNSKEGSEELQINGNIISNKEGRPDTIKSNIEVYYK